MDTPDLSTAQRPGSSWGTIVSILIILVIVVAGAYYAFTNRVSNSSDTSVPAVAPTY